MDGRVEELVKQSLETPCGRGKLERSGYRLEFPSFAAGVRLNSSMVAVDKGEVMRSALGSALMMRSGCVDSHCCGPDTGAIVETGRGDEQGKAIVLFCEVKTPSSSSSSVFIPSSCPLTCSMACTRSDILFCLVRGVSGGFGNEAASADRSSSLTDS